VARLVVFDMDGVLADVESSWVFVHQRFGVNNEHSLHAYLRGEIDDLEFIRRDIALWRERHTGLDESAIAKILDDVPLMPGAKETIVGLKKKGYRTAIVSAGIDLLAHRISRECGIDMFLANGLRKLQSGVLTGEGILNVKLMDKGEAVVRTADALGVRLNDTVSVGNSRYDVTMFERTGTSVAFHPSDDYVRSHAKIVVEEGDLTALLKYL
jgi:phosphoserine phosphatase